MPTKAQLEAQRVAAEARAARGEQPSKRRKKETDRDLNDPNVQAEILDPSSATTASEPLAPKPLTIGGQPVELHPLPAKQQRDFRFSFMPRLGEAAAERGQLQLDALDDQAKIGFVLTRWGRVLSEDAELCSRLCRFIARAEYPPSDAVDPAALEEREGVIDESLSPEELIAVFVTLATVNGVFGAPK